MPRQNGRVQRRVGLLVSDLEVGPGLDQRLAASRVTLDKPKDLLLIRRIKGRKRLLQ